MLPKKYRLSKKEFETAFKKRSSYFKSGFLSAKVSENHLNITRFGISCGLKISKKAVVRNKIKRRLNESLRLVLPEIKKGYDIIIIPTPESVQKTYQEINSCVLGLLTKSNLIASPRPKV